MDCSTGQVQQDYGITGILYDVGSVYESLTKLTDLRKAKGKLYALELVLLIVVMAKLCGEDKPLGMAEWAQNRQEELVPLLKLSWARMPSHHTYRRILAQKVYVEEVERLVGDTTGAVNMVRCMPWMARPDAGCARKRRKGKSMA